MAKSIIEYKVIVSSPSDVKEDRRIAVEVIQEVSSTWGKQNGATLKILMWEDLCPGVASDSQTYINAELGDDWDVYTGLMYTRFGSPTPNFGSGTEEEFERAFKTWNSDPSKSRILFYFRNGAIQVDDIDIDQLAKVRGFKGRLREKGVLYKEYADSESFKDLYRAHLTKTLADLHAKQLGHIQMSNPEVVVINVPAEIDHRDGFLDYYEDAISGSVELKGVLDEIGNISIDFGQLMESEAVNISESSSRADFVGLRKSITTVSNGMRGTAKKLAEKRREYSLCSRKALENMSRAIGLAKSFAPKEVQGSNEFSFIVSEQIIGIQGSIKAIHGLMLVIDSLPNVAKDFSSARLLLKKELGEIKSEFTATINLLNELILVSEA